MLINNNTIIPVANLSITDESRHGEISFIDQTKRLNQYKTLTFYEWSMNFEFYGFNSLWHNPIRGISENIINTYLWYDYNQTMINNSTNENITRLTIPGRISNAEISFDRVLHTSLTILGNNAELEAVPHPDTSGFTVSSDFVTCYKPLQTKIWINGILKPCRDTRLIFSSMATRIDTINGNVVVNSIPSCVINTTVFDNIESVSTIKIQFGDDNGLLWDSTYNGYGKITRINSFRSEVNFLVNS